MKQFNKQAGKTSAGTNIQEVRQQNAQSAQGLKQVQANLVLNLVLNLVVKRMHKK